MFNFDSATGEIFIHDEIGPAWWGLIDAGAVMLALKEIGNKIAHVHLNTPGGSVDEGIAIYNALVQHKAGVVTYVDSLAASMGSYLLQAGTERIVAANSMVMIHDPWTIAFGNATELRKSADVLEKYAARMLPDYARRSGKTEEEVTAIMAEETWYTGREAVDAGFADTLTDASEVAAMVSGLHRIARKVPESIMPGHERKAGDRHSFPNREKYK